MACRRMPSVMNAVTRAMAASMKTAELVIDTSRPPRWNSTRRLMANCSRGLSPVGTTRSSIAAVHFLGRPKHIEHARARAQEEEYQEEKRRRPEPMVEQPADPPSDQQSRQQFHADPKREADGGPGRRVWALDSLV